ncbi:MAG: flagellar basal body rod protein FlgC [Planctomycetota bacterium]
MFTAMDISMTGMMAEGKRLEVIANNLANINTTRDAAGNVSPYRRREVVFGTGSALAGRRGTGVSWRVQEDFSTELKKVYRPGHPDADENGYLSLPNVDLEVEMADMVGASRAYEANVTALEVSKGMLAASLRFLS